MEKRHNFLLVGVVYIILLVLFSLTQSTVAFPGKKSINYAASANAL